MLYPYIKAYYAIYCLKIVLGVDICGLPIWAMFNSNVILWVGIKNFYRMYKKC